MIIDLIFPGGDAYLSLLDDSFTIIESNDDHEDYDSQISILLSPGVYYIEASSYSIGSSGDFELSVSADRSTASVFYYTVVE